MAKQNSVNLDITNNADGFSIAGGSTSRTLGVSGGDITLVGSGSATLTFPTTSTTIAGLGITQTFTVLQQFSGGISASGATFSGNIYAPNIVTSVNGITGAVTGLSASTVMIGSTNSNFTRYLVFAATAGEQSLLVDNVTTPLSYNPNTGTISAKVFEATQGSYTAKIDGQAGTIFVSDSSSGNVNTAVPYGFEYNSAVNPYFFASISTPIFFVTPAFKISDGDYDQVYGPSTWGYTFPAANGTSGQAMFTNGSGQLYWGTVSSSSAATGVTSFNGQTGAVTFVNYVASLNGLTGAVGIAAGTNITITPSGNTLTISASGGSGGGAAGSTITTIDFSSAINQVQFDVIIPSFGVPVIDLASREAIENLVGITAVMLNATESIAVVGTVAGADWYRTDPLPSGVADFLTVTMKPPFYGATSGTSYVAEDIIGLTIAKLGDEFVVRLWDPVEVTGSVMLLHKEETYAIKTITGQSWVAADTFINCKVLGMTTNDHDPEDAILEGVRFEINNIVAGVGFDIIGHAPEGTYGKYKIECLGI
jgi:hypothetical protein